MPENPRIEELRRRVQADPASIAFAALAEEFRRVGRYEDAVLTCRTGLQRHPAYLSARVTLGRALIETGDFDGAREELQTVLRSAPENLAAIRGLDQIRERLGHSAEMDPHIADAMRTLHEESIRVAAQPKPEPIPVVTRPLDPEPEISPGLEPLFLAPEPSMPPAPEPPALEAELSLAPELGLSLGPEPGPAPASAPADAEYSMAPDPGPSSDIQTPVDVFASFAPASAAAPSQDLSFDLSSAFATGPSTERGAEAPVDFSMASPFGATLAAPEAEAAVPRVVEAPAPPVVEAAVPPAVAPAFHRSAVEPAPDAVAEPVLESAFGQYVSPPADATSEAALAPEEEPIFDALPEPVQDMGPDPQVLATLARLDRFLDAIHSLRG